MEKQFKYYFSLVTGQVVRILADEVGLLENYQIPLKKRPKSSCRKCYGRGYNHYDENNLAYNPCSCVKKVIDQEVFNNAEVSFYIPK